MARALCSFPNCAHETSIRGLCSNHHIQQRDGRQLKPTTVPPVCAEDVCQRPANGGQGYCSAHYQWRMAHGLLTPKYKRTKPPTDRLCTHPGCNRTYDRAGYCRTHANRAAESKDLDAPFPGDTITCSTEGCDRTAPATGGICPKHRNELLRRAAGVKPMPIALTVQQQIAAAVPSGACLIWQGSFNVSGEPRIKRPKPDRRWRSARTAVWEYRHGNPPPAPIGLACGEAACIADEHMVPGYAVPPRLEVCLKGLHDMTDEANRLKVQNGYICRACRRAYQREWSRTKRVKA